MTDEQREAKIKALLKERNGYEIHGNTERVKQVNAELRRLGHDAAPPAKRATKRAEKAA